MKFVSLISSGIDSPVATYLISKKVNQIIFVHADIRPFTDDREIENFISIVKYLKKIINCQVKCLLVPHGKNLKIFMEKCNIHLTCVFCKRMLLRYAEDIAKANGCEAIVTGDNLGQVASQTLQNLYVIDQATSLPVLRPLIGFDKEEIIKIAKEIGTYELSISKTIGCMAAPKKPSTGAKVEKILEEERKLNIEKLVNDAIEQISFIEL